jgi:predicted nucleic-acid-binding Zn-ribbon protein
MVPANGGTDGDGNDPTYVYCPECGAKAAADWSFCRSCEASLRGAEPVDEQMVVRNDGEDVDLSEFVGEATGCRKCGHMDAEADDIAATSDGFPWAFDIENQWFSAVSCTRCGYTEFYKGRRSNEALALFMR